MKLLTLLLLCVSLFFVGCSDDSEASDTCASGWAWVGGDSESPEMYPGRACIACHKSEGEGPNYSVAGTLYPNTQEADDCFGLEGLRVEVTDADGKVIKMTSNEAGNFMSTSTFKAPYTAVAFGPDGTEFPMIAPQTNGDCNTCHSSAGASGAAGRVFVN